MNKKKLNSHKWNTFYIALGVMLLIIGLPIFVIVSNQKVNTSSFAYEASLGSHTVLSTQRTSSSIPTTTTCTGNGIYGSVNLSGWKLVNCEDFNETNLSAGTVPSGWYAYSGTNSTVGVGRTPSQCSVGGGLVTLTQLSNGATCAMASNFGQKYGLWEARMRAYTLGGSGSAPHPVLIVWPDNNNWPAGGEYDYAETDIGSPMQAFIHCATSTGGNCITATSNVDYSRWHNYAFAWTPTQITGFIDGRVWYHGTSADIQAPGTMHETIQLDNLSGQAPVKPAQMQVDWVHVYAQK